MNCSDAKHLIHLDVGDDLRSEEERQLAEHMNACGDCRSYHSGMSSAMSALLLLRDAPEPDAAEEPKSVWSSLSQEIRRRQTSPAQARRFNLQVAALSVCSLSLAVVTIVQSLSSMRSSVDVSGGYYSAQPVSNMRNASDPSRIAGGSMPGGSMPSARQPAIGLSPFELSPQMQPGLPQSF